MKTWLVLDCHYLCYRAFNSTQSLAYKGHATGVIFGFLKSLTSLKDEFVTDNIAFCFEHNHLYRRDIYPDYKKRRHSKPRTPEEEKAYGQFHAQLAALRDHYLPQIGFRNVFRFYGMESDDIMASLIKSVGKEDRIVMVTSDKDLLQCLSASVSMYSPQSHTMWTATRFLREYGIIPRKWALVKAIAGCSGDGVKGITGVGEKTALKFVRGELDSDSKAFKLIMAGRDIVLRNRALVKLPYVDCVIPKLHKDDVRKENWVEVCKLLGIRTLAGRPPIATRRWIEE